MGEDKLGAILVTGGAGYIGSHTLVLLLEAGYEVVVVDTLDNSCEESLRRVEQITGKSIAFVRGSVNDRALLDQVFRGFKISAVVHFAGLKAVGESVRDPLAYYRANVCGTLVLCEAMAAAGVFTLVFSSSATVYGDPDQMPISEDQPTGQPSNPYGRTKLVVEGMLRDLQGSDGRWRCALLRYFNPVGAHQSGLIGEDPRDTPNNLLPYVAQVAVGKRPELSVYGDNYNTPDGTGIRDYIHVMDLARGHLAALHYLAGNAADVYTWNLGTGQGYSVLEVVRAFEVASARTIPYKIVPRRSGDIAACYSDPSRAARELNWRAEKSLADMMLDAWRWQSQNPNGYDD
jgi:UDP-glucose 4-epimerase